MAHSDEVPPYDLVVVGAGPVGLLAAYGAARRGCKRVLVLEQARSFANVGRGLNLLPNCVNALKMVAPDVLNTLRNSIPPMVQSKRARITSSGEIRWTQTRDPRTLSVSWYELQTALRTALPDNVHVQTDSRVVSFGDMLEKSSVLVKYISGRPRHNPYSVWNVTDDSLPADASVDDGTIKEVRANIVIGADGIHSCCRGEIYRAVGGGTWMPLASPLYSGYSMTISLLSDSSPLATELVEMMKENELSLTRIECGSKGDFNRVTLWDGHGFLAIASIVRLNLAMRNQKRELRDFLAKAAVQDMDYDPLIKVFQKLAKDDTPDQRFSCFPQYVVPTVHPLPFRVLNQPDAPKGFWRPFGHGRVFLAGDSAHGCPPTMAQGTAMGFEDVCEIVDLLANTLRWGTDDSVNPGIEVLQQVERTYRERRVNRISIVQEHSVYPKILTLEQDAELWKYVYDWKPVSTGWY